MSSKGKCIHSHPKFYTIMELAMQSVNKNVFYNRVPESLTSPQLI